MSAQEDSLERQRLLHALAEAERRQTDLQQRLGALVPASGPLFGSPPIDDVLPGIIVLARTLIPADGYAVWRFDAASSAWHIAASAGVSGRFASRIVAAYGGDHVVSAPFSEPLVAQSVHAVPLLEERADAY